MSPLPSGRALINAEEIFARVGLRPGMRYTDLGAGTLGHFVFPASEIVGAGGEVFAVDILKGAISALNSRIKLDQIQNVTTIWGDIEKINGVDLPDNSQDIASLINVASLIKKSPSVLQEAQRILKPNGMLFIIGWKPDAGVSMGTDRKKRVSPEEARSIAEKNQFLFIEAFEAGPYHWGVLFQNRQSSG